MGESKAAPITVACEIAGGKTVLPVDICALFEARLAQAFPHHRIAIAREDANAPATVRLLVTRAAPRSLEASLFWSGSDDGSAAPPLGTALFDRDLGAAEVGAFLDRLIASSPAPAAVGR